MSSNHSSVTESIQNGFYSWKKSVEELEAMFQARNTNESAALLERGLSLFIEMLHLTNEQTVSNEGVSFENLKLKPINVEERIRFILSRPGSYHSFKQLTELFKELEKLYAKKTSLEKR